MQAEAAARALHEELHAGAFGPLLRAKGGGKMFGVLVAKDASDREHTLRAFSGQLAGRWDHEGFAPPIFDRTRRAAVELPGEIKVKALLDAHSELAASPTRLAAIAALEKLDAHRTESTREMTARHAENRARRQARRSSEDGHALDQESRRDKAERRRHDQEHDLARAAITRILTPLDRRLRALERLRRIICSELMRLIHDTYVVANARGETRPLRTLFAPHVPPAGAGDCAAPKLFAEAYARGLTPLALAEIFVGDGPREDGALSSPCGQKCAPLLAFMQDAAPPPPFDVLYEDDALLVVDKPAGVLSVPGKHVSDSMAQRLAGARLVHRLDQDTSGVLVAAKSDAAYHALQRQFAARTVEKRYVAILERAPTEDAGTITLPLRVDPSDRPRQVVDHEHGKHALTEWRLLDRAAKRIAFQPLTGRTHQLRVHAAAGLCAPIKGDRLYGSMGERLLLHAERIAFDHPLTGARVEFVSDAPF